MHKPLILLVLIGSTVVGQTQEAIPTVRIQPEDIVKHSIQQVRIATNKFAVRWTYTEAGAKKMLAFWEQHAGRKVRTRVGDFETPLSMISPQDPVKYPAWREGWLKYRTDKFFGVSEDDARKIVGGLTGK